MTNEPSYTSALESLRAERAEIEHDLDLIAKALRIAPSRPDEYEILDAACALEYRRLDGDPVGELIEKLYPERDLAEGYDANEDKARAFLESLT